MELRGYQCAWIEEISAALSDARAVLGVLPTGAGKTVCFARIVAEAAAAGQRVVITAHRIEIVRQISAALHRAGVEHGLMVAGQRTSHHRVTVAMVQTLARRLAAIPEPDMIVCDEAHHAVAATWSTILDGWRGARILGVTATPLRLDGRGLGGIFDRIVVGPSVRELIDAGYLAGFRHFASRRSLDTAGLTLRGGDYDAGAAAAALTRQRIVGDAVTEYRRLAAGETAVAFCPTVEAAASVAEEFSAAGIPAASIDGSMSHVERAGILEALRVGALRVVTSCELISEGFDLPAIGAAILLRPTQSLALYLQQVGRALRPKPSGGHAIIIDHVGAGLVHGLVDHPRQWSLDPAGPGGTPAPQVRQCPICYRVADASGRPPDCGAEHCGLERQASAVGKTVVREVSGELEEIRGRGIVPAWSGGLDLATAPLRDVVRRATTEEHLHEIARARGYHPRWVMMVQTAGGRRPATQWRRRA